MYHYLYSDLAAIEQKTIYSTDETVVGTWITGKPLYRKAITYTGVIRPADIIVKHGISNVEDIFIPFCVMRDISGNYAQYGNMVVMVNSEIVRLFRENSTGILTGTHIIILEYTKTTD